MFKINIEKFLIFILSGCIIFQDSITNILSLNIFNYMDECLILIFSFYSLFHIRKKFPKIILKLIFLICGFWLCGIISGLMNSQIQVFSFLMQSFLMVKFFILIISIILISPNEKLINYMRQAIFFWGWISAFTGIINFCFHSIWIKIIPYAYLYNRNGFNSVQGLFIHAGQYGWFMLFVALLYISEFYYTKDKKSLKNAIIMTICSFLSIKAKVLGGFLVVILFIVFCMKNRAIDIKKITIIFMGLTVFVRIFWDFLYSTFSMYFTNTGDVTARFALLNGSINILKDYFPLGVGFSKFGSYYASVNYSEYYYKYNLYWVYGLKPNDVFFGTDTFWPAIMGETGILGTLLYIIMIIIIFKFLYKGLKKENFSKNNEKIKKSQILFAILVLLQALVESLGEPIFNSSPQNICIGISIGIAIVSILNKNNEYKR